LKTRKDPHRSVVPVKIFSPRFPAPQSFFAWIIGFFWLWVFPGILAASDITPHPESDVKAAFIFNFTKFVEWPDQDVNSGRLVIGYWGDENLIDNLKKLDGRKSLNRHVEVRKISDLCETEKVHVLVISRDRFLDKKTLKELSERHVLTISEGLDSLEKGIILTLFKEDNKIRFAVNLKSADLSKLRISSRLLKLARYIAK